MRFREACLWTGIPLALFCVWLLFFCIPIVSQIEDKKGELAGVEARIARIETQLSQPEKAPAEGTGRAALQNFPDQIPRLEAFPEFMKKIASSVRKGGVTVDRLNGRLDDHTGTAGSALAYPVTEMDVTGQFMDIGRVLEQIQTVKAYRRIVRARLLTGENVYPDIKGSIEIEFKAWRD